MRFDGLADVPGDWPRSTVTIGVFDGVHLGHQALLARAKAVSDGHRLVAVTFDPHPIEVVRPGTHPALLTSLSRRVSLLQAVGADSVLVLPFTKELSGLTPEEFARDVLSARLHASLVVVGANFRFGHRASGTVETLRELGAVLDFDVDAVELVGNQTTTWSSTYIRECVTSGQVAEAALRLGRPHRVEGVVVHGDHRGRELGYPTANLQPIEHAAIPADGVYAGWLVREPNGTEVLLPAAISIGTNPTFDGVERRAEAYVLDRTDLKLYGAHVAFDFAQLLRPTLRFDDVESLLTQMADDVDQTRDVLSG